MPQDDESLPGYDPLTNRFSDPPYFGPESTALLNRINERIGNTEALSKTIAFGTALSMATDPPTELAAKRSHDFTSSAQAMATLPTILRNRIRTEVQLALAGPEFKRMNQQERNFWEALEKNIEHPPKWPPLRKDPTDLGRKHSVGPEACWCGDSHPNRHEPWAMDCDKAPPCWCEAGKHCGAGISR